MAQGSTARRPVGYQVPYLRRDFTYEDLAVGGGVVGIIPAGSLILRLTVVTSEAFNDTTADDLDVGFSLGGDELGAAMDINSPTIDIGDIAAADVFVAADATVYFAPTSTATGDGTTGAGSIIVEFIPPDE